MTLRAGRLVLAISALAAALAACGHYGPPVRPEPGAKGGYTPLPEPDAPPSESEAHDVKGKTNDGP